jgi:hypothetical protein
MTIRSFVFGQSATVYPSGAWQFAAGAFTGQARSDLFGYDAGDGSLWVGANTGDGFTFQLWATVDPVDGWSFTVGDFSGDGRTDIVGYYPSNGILWIGDNPVGTHFAFRQAVSVDPVDGWQFATGYFTGHSKSDLFGYHPSNGSLWVGENTGDGFSFQQWGTVDPVAGWRFIADDVTGNGRTDIVGYDPGSGSLVVGENTGTGFWMNTWATLDPTRAWQFATGHFTGRARSDVFAYDPSDGVLWVGENTGNSFSFQQWGAVAPADGWQFAAGVFNADLWTDIAGYHSTSGTVWVGKSTPHPIEGYCWPLSAAPGETIQFMFSGEGPSHAVIQRNTSTSSAIDSVNVTTLDFVATTQTAPATVIEAGCAWADSFSLTTPDWPSGLYSASCTDDSTTSFDVSFVVKPAADKRSSLAILANVNTWLAYNGWGGASKYSGAARTSFLRPMPGAAPNGDAHLTRGELWVLGWLGAAGYQPDVYSDIDFHNDGCDPSQYRCLILSTHPEYWSRQMYRNLAAYLDQGGSLLYLGGNGIYENGEYEAGQTTISFRQGVEGGPRVTSLFRVLNPPMAERSLLGVATERCGVEGSAYRIDAADHQLFADVRITDPVSGVLRQVVNGDLVGASGLNLGFGNGKASAWEVDTRDGLGATTVPVDCATEDAFIPPSSLPDGLVVLASGEADDKGPGAEMVFYEHPGGGLVFSVGSLTFGGSLVVDPALQQLVRNVLTRAGVA